MWKPGFLFSKGCYSSVLTSVEMRSWPVFLALSPENTPTPLGRRKPIVRLMKPKSKGLPCSDRMFLGPRERESHGAPGLRVTFTASSFLT